MQPFSRDSKDKENFTILDEIGIANKENLLYNSSNMAAMTLLAHQEYVCNDVAWNTFLPLFCFGHTTWRELAPTFRLIFSLQFKLCYQQDMFSLRFVCDLCACGSVFVCWKTSEEQLKNYQTELYNIVVFSTVVKTLGKL